jgi:DNA-3-methyladenine glycosylase I
MAREGIVRGDDGVRRCSWAVGDPLMQDYHDREWARPTDDDTRIFEKLCLEGFQSGLSWQTILRKRENFRRAFRGFDVERVARFGERDVQRLLSDAGIVRHRGKIESTINNARRCLELGEERSLAAHVWSFAPVRARRSLDHATLMQLTTTDEAKALSKDLKKRGWSFVGPTTVYAAMQALGLVNDHLSGCTFRREVEAERAAFSRPSR